MSKAVCEPCAGTGILSASLVQGEEERHIAVIVCGGAHFSHEVVEKNILAMHNATGLNVDIVGTEKPGRLEKQEKK